EGRKRRSLRHARESPSRKLACYHPSPSTDIGPFPFVRTQPRAFLRLHERKRAASVAPAARGIAAGPSGSEEQLEAELRLPWIACQGGLPEVERQRRVRDARRTLGRRV